MTWRKAALIGAVALYAVSLLWLSIGTPGTFTSPDENAAHVFAQLWRTTGDLRAPESLNLALHGVVHPRSVLAVGPWLVPGSFLGLPVLAGTIGVVTGPLGMLLVTPLLAIVAVFAWRSVVQRLLGNDRVANIAAVLLAVCPAFWFYSARTMMHNVAFVAFLIFAAWFVVARVFSSHRINFALAGLCIGLALVIRTSEAPWIGIALVGLCIAYRPSVDKIFALIAGLALPLVLLASLQAHLYGSPVTTGYTVASGDASDAAAAPLLTKEGWGEVGAMVLPFGFHEKAIAKNVWHFGLALFPWMTVFAVAGGAIVLQHSMSSRAKAVGRPESRDPWKVLLILLIALAAWLGIVYGSWSFNDNPDPTVISLGDSHIRYWLPVFVLATPFMALAILTLVRGKIRAAWAVTGLVAALSFVLVFFGHDGLWSARQELFESATKRDAILASTEIDAVVVVDRADKFLWPWRSVIVPLRDEKTYAAMPDVVDVAPLYYFGIPFPDVDIAYLNEQKLAGLGLRIDLVSHIGDEALYRIMAVE